MAPVIDSLTMIGTSGLPIIGFDDCIFLIDAVSIKFEFFSNQEIHRFLENLY